jgi:hypothetical protein
MFGDLITGWPSVEPALLDCLRSGHFAAFARATLTLCRLRRQSLVDVVRVLRRVHSNDRLRTFQTSQFSPAAMAGIRQLPSDDLQTVFGLNREFAKRAFTPTNPVAIDPVGRSATSRSLLYALALYTLYDSGSGPQWFSVRTTHPFMDRPLVEFMLGLDPELIWSPVHPRAFAIASLRDVLPDAVLNRGHKGDMRPAYIRDVAPLAIQAAAEVDDWLLVEREYADPATLKQIFGRFVDCSQQNHIVVGRLLSAEVLLRRIQSRSRAVSQAVAAG